MSGAIEVKQMFEIANEARRLERERVVAMFSALASQMEVKADQDDGDIGLVWTAAAASVRRVCDEALE